jgi:hemerythrin
MAIVTWTEADYGTNIGAADEGHRTIRYPDFAAHKAAHDKRVETAVALHEQVKSGETRLSTETTLFVRDWLMNHIPTVDKPDGP